MKGGDERELRTGQGEKKSEMKKVDMHVKYELLERTSIHRRKIKPVEARTR